VKTAHVLLAIVLAIVGVGAFGPRDASAEADRFQSAIAAGRARGATSVEDFLAVLPQDVWDRYTLLYRSESLQQASYSNPRVVLFGGDGALLVAFNGDPALEGYKTVEAIEYDEAHANYNFFLVDFSSSEMKVQSNPEVCAACHRSALRPNWEAYSFWPGAYGAQDDSLAATSGEREHFQEFEQSARAHARYSMLPNLADNYDPDPSNRAIQVFGAPVFRTKAAANSALSQAMALHHAKRIASRLRQRPSYSEQKYMIVGLALQAFRSIQLGTDNAHLVQTTFDDSYHRALQGIVRKWSSVLEAMSPDWPANGPSDFHTSARQVLQFLQIADGETYELADWSTVRRLADYAPGGPRTQASVSIDPFATGVSGFGEVAVQLILTDPDFAPIRGSFCDVATEHYATALHRFCPSSDIRATIEWLAVKAAEG
jgi:hypothetical protein